MAVAVAMVLLPGVPLGLLTEAVQTLAGVLLPSAVVFLLLLCNDKAVLGPWVNGRKLNVLASLIVWVLVLLSLVLTASVMLPNITGRQIVLILAIGSGIGLACGLLVLVRSHRRARRALTVPAEWEDRTTWRMPPLHLVGKPVLSTPRKVGLVLLRGYLLVAFVLVIVKVVEVAIK